MLEQITVSNADLGRRPRSFNSGADALWAFVAFDVDLPGSTIHRNRCLVIQRLNGFGDFAGAASATNA